MHDTERPAVEEALFMAINEGLLTPEEVRSWDDDQKKAWYDKVTDYGPDVEEVEAR